MSGDSPRPGGGRSFYEFFAGGGMARLGLGSGWRCLYANDFDPRKARAYRANFGGEELAVKDVREVRAAELPGRPDLVWGSFPCQDLSLAGRGRGLASERSGSFYPFWDVVRGLRELGRAPALVAVENVCGTLTSHGGRDFEAIWRTFLEAGYRPGALVIDAALFTPQSRPRLFVVGLRGDVDPPAGLLASAPQDPFHTRQLAAAVEALPTALRGRGVWWRLAAPAPRTVTLADLVEADPAALAWHGAEQTARLVAMMTPLHRARLEALGAAGAAVGGLYRRTRREADGGARQRAEVRFDGLAGCLRTPAGGSSRQTLVFVEGQRVRTRLLSAREAARLMGLPDSYVLPARYSDAYRLAGDGVSVDVVRHLARHLLEPLLAGAGDLRAAA